MGLSSSKSSTKSNQTATIAPSTYNQPYIDSAATAANSGYDAATANNATLQPRITSALDYSGGVMNGDYLDGNPHLQGVIDSTNRDITTGVDSRFEGAGRYGSGQHAGILARALADNENKLRYGDYSQERSYQQQAPGQIAALTGVSAALPQMAGNTYADTVARLLGGYNTSTSSGTSTTKTSPNIGMMMLQAAQAAAQAYAAGG